MTKAPPRFLPNPKLSLREVATVVFRGKWVILFTLLTAVVVTIIIASRTTDKYESRLKLLVKNMRADVQVTASEDDPIINNQVSESEINSEIELLKGRDLLEQVVKRVNLADAFPNVDEAKALEQAIYKLEKDLNVASVKKANIIEVSYSSPSPELSAAVLNHLAELYLDKHLKVHHPPGAFEFFKNQADVYANDLSRAENKFSNFQQRTGSVGIDQQKELTINRLAETRSKLKDLEGAISESDKRIAALTSQLSTTDKRITTQNRVIPNQYSVERMSTLLVELKNRRTQLLNKYQPADRVVREVDEQIAVTTDALDKASRSTSSEEATDVNPLRQTLELDLNKAKVDQAGRIALRKNLSDQVAAYQEQLTRLNGVTVVHDELERQVKRNEESYQLYAKKEEESRIGDALDKQKISNVSIAEAPIVPLAPRRNERLLVVILGISAGLFFGFGAAFVRELLRDTFYSPNELEVFSGKLVLATIPFQALQTGRHELEVVAEMDEDDLYGLSNEVLDENDLDYSGFFTDKDRIYARQ